MGDAPAGASDVGVDAEDLGAARAGLLLGATIARGGDAMGELLGGEELIGGENGDELGFCGGGVCAGGALMGGTGSNDGDEELGVGEVDTMGDALGGDICVGGAFVEGIGDKDGDKELGVGGVGTEGDTPGGGGCLGGAFIGGIGITNGDEELGVGGIKCGGERLGCLGGAFMGDNKGGVVPIPFGGMIRGGDADGPIDETGGDMLEVGGLASLGGGTGCEGALRGGLFPDIGGG